MNKFIHLLYVPTMNCNMQCSYCYLGDQTRDSNSPYGAVDTLRTIVWVLIRNAPGAAICTFARPVAPM